MAMLCVVNAHQSLAVEIWGFQGKKRRASMPGCKSQEKVLQTGAVVPIYALGDEQHAYSRLILSSSVPLAYIAQGTAPP